MMVEFKMMMVELETIMMWNCHSGLVTFPALAKSAVLKRTHFEHTATLIVTLIQTHSHAVFLRRCSVFWGVSSIQNTLVLLLFGRKSSLCVLWHLRYSELNKLEKGERGEKRPHKSSDTLGSLRILQCVGEQCCLRNLLSDFYSFVRFLYLQTE